MRTFLIFGNSTKEKVDDMYNVDRTDVEVERQIVEMITIEGNKSVGP